MSRVRRWLYRKGVPMVDRWGVAFEHKGDSVIWLWPWKRNFSKNKPFYSISFGSSFDTLFDIDLEWWAYSMHELAYFMKKRRTWRYFGGYNAKSS